MEQVDVLEEKASKLTPAQLRFMRSGKEDTFADRRVTRALCAKGLMGHAGYVLGFDLYAFTALGLKLREHVQSTVGRLDG